ncbi:response regulator [Ancylothrix sp. C2]|uniref:hybrid sensor histidine kinase/response regulator n=1 Tax=Ancylothrix sp. D3o TaxID=2953691 RepID=UPI0021BB450C|nr:response regulator [Ancylothrix sp. D3o]MCT7949830.1 response regulator [Ancylothrix sp. D3o]
MNEQPTKAARTTILVVDDTPANLRLLVVILGERGYDVRPARDGVQALSIAKRVNLDLILLDINMPGMDGYQVCEQLKADKQTCEIPVIFISALTEAFNKVKAFSVGGVDYIAKPFEVEEVLARVRTHLSMRALQKTLAEKNDNLEQKNQELNTTLKELQATQSQLIQSEKMAALGQLIAGIAHELNTPLAAIQSTAGNLAKFLSETLAELPKLCQNLSETEADYFWGLLQKSLQAKPNLTTKEKRLLKKNLISFLEEEGVADADMVADTLVDMGIYDDVEDALPMLRKSQGNYLLDVAYKLSELYRGTQRINTATERAAKVVFALKSYAHYEASGVMTQANIIEGIETILTLYENLLKQGVEVIRNYEDLGPVWCYPDELNQVWTNLIHNALQAMEYRGTLTIDVAQNKGWVKVTLTDSGKGISPEIIPNIFEPFFTTKSAGEGSGLGLNIVKKIIDKHSGKITVESVPGNTTFQVLLPVDKEDVESEFCVTST